MRQLLMGLMTITLCFVLIGKVDASSTPLPSDEVLAEYNLSQATLNEAMISDDDVNAIGELVLTKGFSSKSTSTFNKNKSISGEAAQGATVSVIVYNGEGEITQDYSKEIGASGIYDEIIQLTEGKVNYILIFVQGTQNDACTIYQINRKSIAIKENLEGFKVSPLP